MCKHELVQNDGQPWPSTDSSNSTSPAPGGKKIFNIYGRVSGRTVSTFTSADRRALRNEAFCWLANGVFMNSEPRPMATERKMLAVIDRIKERAISKEEGTEKKPRQFPLAGVGRWSAGLTPHIVPKSLVEQDRACQADSPGKCQLSARCSSRLAAMLEEEEKKTPQNASHRPEEEDVVPGTEMVADVFIL
ncbi:hypothetical protein Baya_6712 [Bagarius yarrelli]|uniref:Uncharacterized protein n=1 Tax=Bagarius yarrelli TaxID=175774 RepID=A0A556U1M7_BAGYA|nr:hypothetical protein Baya_6712 [Bagarius yarrelli]